MSNPNHHEVGRTEMHAFTGGYHGCAVSHDAGGVTLFEMVVGRAAVPNSAPIPPSETQFSTFTQDTASLRPLLGAQPWRPRSGTHVGVRLSMLRSCYSSQHGSPPRRNTLEASDSWSLSRGRRVPRLFNTSSAVWARGIESISLTVSSNCINGNKYDPDEFHLPHVLCHASGRAVSPNRPAFTAPYISTDVDESEVHKEMEAQDQNISRASSLISQAMKQCRRTSNFCQPVMLANPGFGKESIAEKLAG